MLQKRCISVLLMSLTVFWPYSTLVSGKEGDLSDIPCPILVAALDIHSNFTSYSTSLMPVIKGAEMLRKVLDRVGSSSNLSQVLQEFLNDIKIVEEAVLNKCYDGQRTRHQKASDFLKTTLRQCADQSCEENKIRVCLGNKTKSLTSEVRQFIVDMKRCVDEATR
uniref:Uncharacterized protein n=1 Tax=Cuerna arida TaxID=1464854 RepID=A0A1B6FTN1_9HEMI